MSAQKEYIEDCLRKGNRISYKMSIVHLDQEQMAKIPKDTPSDAPIFSVVEDINKNMCAEISFCFDATIGPEFREDLYPALTNLVDVLRETFHEQGLVFDQKVEAGPQ